MPEIIGYTYGGYTYCPADIIAQLPTGPGGQFDGWAADPDIIMSPEEWLDEVAAAFQIDREHAHMDYFPRIVTLDNDWCCLICHECGNELEGA